MANSSIETELKLTLHPQDIARVQQHPLLKGARKLAPQKLHSIYFDTPALELWKSGYALRLRKIGNAVGKWVQTIKGGGAVNVGLHQRMEIETEITLRGSAVFPDFSVITEPAFAAHFADPILRARLKPALITEFTRTRYLIVPNAGIEIEASIDVGVVRAHAKSLPICELELEMKQGAAWRAHQIALQLLDAAPLRVEDISKAERGLMLLRGEQPAPQRAQNVALTHQQSTGDAFKTIVSSCLAHFVANQRGFLEENNPEYLHQMRVALRRLRSAFSLFTPLFPEAVIAQPLNELRWLSSALGNARDWDVFDTETLPALAAHHENHHGMYVVHKTAKALRTSTTRIARRAVAGKRGQGFLLALGGWLVAETWQPHLTAEQHVLWTMPALRFADASLARAHARVKKRGRHFATLAPPALHRVRIAAKKLRYATDFFATLYSEKRVEAFRETLSKLQDALGSYNDAATIVRLSALLEAAHKNKQKTPQHDVSEARGILLGWSAGLQNAGIAQLQRHWKTFTAAKPFWE